MCGKPLFGSSCNASPSLMCHFSGLGLKKGINFRFLSPYIGSGFKNLCSTPLHVREIYGIMVPLGIFKTILQQNRSNIAEGKFAPFLLQFLKNSSKVHC